MKHGAITVHAPLAAAAALLAVTTSTFGYLAVTTGGHDPAPARPSLTTEERDAAHRLQDPDACPQVPMYPPRAC
jgi:hypothetical protein